jgi:hypothetical protein
MLQTSWFIPKVNQTLSLQFLFCYKGTSVTLASYQTNNLRFSRRWLWRMSSSGMLRRVALVRTDISEELSSSFIKVTRVGELGTTLAVTTNRRKLRRNTKWILLSDICLCKWIHMQGDLMQSQWGSLQAFGHSCSTPVYACMPCGMRVRSKLWSWLFYCPRMGTLK